MIRRAVFYVVGWTGAALFMLGMTLLQVAGDIDR